MLQSHWSAQAERTRGQPGLGQALPSKTPGTGVSSSKSQNPWILRSQAFHNPPSEENIQFLFERSPKLPPLQHPWLVWGRTCCSLTCSRGLQLHQSLSLQGHLHPIPLSLQPLPPPIHLISPQAQNLSLGNRNHANGGQFPAVSSLSVPGGFTTAMHMHSLVFLDRCLEQKSKACLQREGDDAPARRIPSSLFWLLSLITAPRAFNHLIRLPTAG